MSRMHSQKALIQQLEALRDSHYLRHFHDDANIDKILTSYRAGVSRAISAVEQLEPFPHLKKDSK